MKLYSHIVRVAIMGRNEGYMANDYNLKSIKQEFKDKGIFYTPPELALFLKSFLPDDVTEIYDPTCGNGGLLSVFDDDVMKWGQDINAEQVEDAKARMQNFTGIAGDTLTEPAFYGKKFDYIIANPPFSIKWEQNKEDDRFNVCPYLAPKSKADYAFILHILHYLSNNGKAVILGFPGVLYRGNSEGKIRQWLVDNNYIEKIVAVGGDKFVDTKISTCVIILNKNKPSTDIVMVDDVLGEERTVAKNEIVENGYTLSVSTYIQEKIQKEEIDTKELQSQARKGFLKKLEAELFFEKMVCKMEQNSINDFLDQIKSICDQFYD